MKAAAAIGCAEVQGASLKSQQLLFVPKQVKPGQYHFDIGTAGSTSLVCQTLLPALLTAEGSSELILEGGTHNPLAPPYEFLQEAFLPLLARMGARVAITLVRPGFFPTGGGQLRVEVEPVSGLQSLELESREGKPVLSAKALLARLPEHIAQRELAVVGRDLEIGKEYLTTESFTETAGPGNALIVSVQSRNVIEVFASFGMKGVRAETVAQRLVADTRRYLSAEVPVGKYLADQLLVPLSLAGSGSFRTLRPSAHTLTNIEVLHRFLDARFHCEELGRDDWRITLQSRVS